MLRWPVREVLAKYKSINGRCKSRLFKTDGMNQREENKSRIKNNGIIEVSEWKDKEDGYIKFAATIGGTIMTGSGGLKLYLFDWGGEYEKIIYNGLELDEKQTKKFLKGLKDNG